MPIGNGDVTSGVWVDGDTGDLRMYISKSDVFDENSQPVKLAILRLCFDDGVADCLSEDVRTVLRVHREASMMESRPKSWTKTCANDSPVLR